MGFHHKILQIQLLKQKAKKALVAFFLSCLNDIRQIIWTGSEYFVQITMQGSHPICLDHRFVKGFPKRKEENLVE